MAKSGKYSLKERLNIEELSNTLMGLAPRDQILAIVGIAMVLLLLIVIPMACASSHLSKLQKQMDTSEKDVHKVLDKISQYQQAQAKLTALESRIFPESQVQLTSKIEALATSGGINQNIDGLKPSDGDKSEEFTEKIVTVQISRLTLSQLMEFLYNIENQNDLRLNIKRLELTPRFDNRQQFNANFDVSTFVRNEAPGGGLGNPGGGG